MKRLSVGSWLVGIVALLYFIVPLVATAQFSFQEGPGQPFWAAYTSILESAQFWQSLRLSLGMALAAVVIGLIVVVPAAYWAYLRVPQLKPWIEFVSILPFVVPPIVLVLGLVRLYASGFGPLSARVTMLMGAYGVVSLPYMFRSIDTGLRSMNVKALTEAALGMGASWTRIMFQVVLPNIRQSLLGGAFLTFALIMGEYAISSMLGFNTFGVYMLLTGQTQAQGAAALAIIAFILVWFFVAIMQWVSRNSITTIGGSR
ncbi:MAG: ABC transporter permease subunit [Firmicutes bacterium]|nr:ABC transporter permease subunit [Bacillota bacterium]